MAKKEAEASNRELDVTLPIYQVKITLDYIDPPIWRRVQTNDCPLNELHDIIQTSMGWWDEHMYAFLIDGEDLGDPRRGSQAEYDCRTAWLSALADDGTTSFSYDYDFSDEWRHTIEIEKTLPVAEGVTYPRCLEGERSCPPEECGGPHEYPYLLEKLQNPEQIDHDDFLNWIDDDVDPEKFDLEHVNRELHRLRRWLGRRKRMFAIEAAFAKGDLVQVKPGVVHERYPDIPVGGWVGRIKRIGWLTPIGYAVHWTAATLEQAHPILFSRSARDEEKPHRHWFNEDQLESAASETPTAMEQPTNLVTRPLVEEDADDRIRIIFGLTSEEGLPRIGEQTQQQYLAHLNAHLVFPFKAEYWTESLQTECGTEPIEILGFAEPPLDAEQGILCRVRQGKRLFQMPLTDIEVDADDPNSQVMEDYHHWFWETQYDEEESPFPIGTVAHYGPDDKMTTKIVAGVLQGKGAEPIIKRWVASDVATNPKVRKEIEAFFKRYAVRQVAMTPGNIGCPHEEGEDFPMGGDCPFCPWWKGKQGSGAGG